MVRRAGHEVRVVRPEALGAMLGEGEIIAVITGLSRWAGGIAEPLLQVGQSGANASVLVLSGGDTAELELAERLGPALGVRHTEALRLPVHAWQLRAFLDRACASRDAAAVAPGHGA